MKSQVWFDKHLAGIEGITDFKPTSFSYDNYYGEFTYKGVVFKLNSQYSARTEIRPVVPILDKYGRDIDSRFYYRDNKCHKLLWHEFKISKYLPMQTQLDTFMKTTLELIELAREFCEQVDKRLTKQRELYEKVYSLLLHNQPIPDNVPPLTDEPMVINEIESAIVKVYVESVDVVIQRTYTPENVEQLWLLF